MDAQLEILQKIYWKNKMEKISHFYSQSGHFSKLTLPGISIAWLG